MENLDRKLSNIFSSYVLKVLVQISLLVTKIEGKSA